MKIKTILAATLLVYLALAVQHASAAWTLLDSFNSYTNGPLGGQGVWTNAGAGNIIVTNTLADTVGEFSTNGG